MGSRKVFFVRLATTGAGFNESPFFCSLAFGCGDFGFSIFGASTGAGAVDFAISDFGIAGFAAGDEPFCFAAIPASPGSGLKSRLFQSWFRWLRHAWPDGRQVRTCCRYKSRRQKLFTDDERCFAFGACHLLINSRVCGDFELQFD